MTTAISKVIHHLRSALLLRDGADLTDGQLLECFVSRQEAAALEALVRRHGPMVWGVCRRILRNHHDAEDAFQATFLVLVRKAASVTPREMVGNWLYGVAQQTALKLRATGAKQRARERRVVDMRNPAVEEQDRSDELQSVLDRELNRLPDKYRVAIVLCDLEGRTRKAAARQLGLPEGTLAGRLTRGRALLANRLARRGLPVTGGTLATLLCQKAASASVPTSVLSSTIKAVTLVAAGKPLAKLVSVKVAVLAEGVLKAMLISKLRIPFVALVLSAVVLTLGAIAGQHQPGPVSDGKAQIKAAEPPKADAKPAKTAVAKAAFGLAVAPKPAEKKKLHVLLFAGAPVRDYQFVRGLLLEELKDKRLELSMLLQEGDVTADVEGARVLTEFPDRPGSDTPGNGTRLSDYDVILAFDPDWSQLSKAQQVKLNKWVAKHNGGILFVAGPAHTHQLAKLAEPALSPIQKLVPVVLKDARLVDYDKSRPYALRLGPKTTINLGPMDEAPTAAWNRFFWDDDKFEPDPDQPQQPTRGFHTCYPVEKLMPVARTLLSFAGPKELRMSDGKTDPPYLASMLYGGGKSMYLGSAETWRLRAYNRDYHKRFWLQLIHELTPPGTAKK
jgi:RNA polymerase sigma factor (sigma-70 family)